MYNQDRRRKYTTGGVAFLHFSQCAQTEYYHSLNSSFTGASTQKYKPRVYYFIVLAPPVRPRTPISNCQTATLNPDPYKKIAMHRSLSDQKQVASVKINPFGSSCTGDVAVMTKPPGLISGQANWARGAEGGAFPTEAFSGKRRRNFSPPNNAPRGVPEPPNWGAGNPTPEGTAQGEFVLHIGLRWGRVTWGYTISNSGVPKSPTPMDLHRAGISVKGNWLRMSANQGLQ
jgi:hypothetical protein